MKGYVLMLNSKVLKILNIVVVGIVILLTSNAADVRVAEPCIQKQSTVQDLSGFESERLCFRLAKHQKDIDHIVQTIESKEDMNFMWGPNYTSQRIRQIYTQRLKHNKTFLAGSGKLSNFLLWIVEDKETKAYIGYIGCMVKKDGCFLSMPIGNGKEQELYDLYRNQVITKIAIAVDPSKRQQGYAYEMEKGIIDALFDNTNVTVMLHTCVEENMGSRKLAEKLGFTFQGKFVDVNKFECVYTLSKIN